MYSQNMLLLLLLEKEYAVAFGIKRGACTLPCKCVKYSPKAPGGSCDTCGHFPAAHEDLGKVQEDEPRGTFSIFE
jgi:hypothetical protein